MTAKNKFWAIAWITNMKKKKSRGAASFFIRILWQTSNILQKAFTA